MTKTINFWGFTLGVGAAFLLIFLIAAGPLFFRGDEWVVPANVDNSLGFSAAVKALAEVAHRPLQSIPNALTYYVFDFHDLAYRAISLLFHLLNVGAFALVVRRAFPQGDRIALVASLLVFFTPVLATLFFNFSFDGTRLALLYYWGAVYALQSWIARDKPLSPVLWVEIAIVLLVMSFLTYENALFLAPVTLGLVWSTARTQGIALKTRDTLILWARIIASVAAAYALWWGIRWFLDIDLHASFAALSPANFLNNMVKIFAYVWRTPEQIDGWIVAAGVGAFIAAGGLLWRVWQISPTAQTEPETSAPTYWRVLALLIGIGLWVFGLAPYTITALTGVTDIALDGGLRIYSVSVFGIALLVGLLATWSLPRPVRYGLGIVCAVYVAVQTASLFGLRLHYQAMSNTYRSLYRDLATLVPNVDENAMFVIINGHIPDKDINVVFADTNAIHTLYHPSTPVLFLFDETRGPTPELRTRFMRTISSEGVHYSDSFPPAPLDDLIILRRDGDHLQLVETLTPADATHLLVDWQDSITEIHTNPAMILNDRNLVQDLETKGLLPSLP